MSSPQTIADLLQMFAGFEQRALDLYRHLAQVFAGHPALGTIWRAMSDAEAGHFAILCLAEDRLPAGSMAIAESLGVDENRLAEWKSRLDQLEAKGRRPGIAPAEAAEVTLAWELEEMPRLLTLLSALPEKARRLTAAGFIEGAEEHLRCLRELLTAVGRDPRVSDVSRLEESVASLRLLASG